MRIFILLLVATIAAACSGGAAAATAPSQIAAIARPLRIVALGDSLTSGHGLSKEEAYPAVLERTLQSAGLPFTVVNHGVSGDTTTEGLRRLGAALDEQPSILIVALGANDGLKGIPVSEARANLEKIIETAQSRGVEVLLCAMETVPLQGLQYFLEFHQLFPQLAAKYNLPLVPFILSGVLGDRRLMLPDGVHPNAAGATQMARTIWPYLQPLAIRASATQRSVRL